MDLPGGPGYEERNVGLQNGQGGPRNPAAGAGSGSRLRVRPSLRVPPEKHLRLQGARPHEEDLRLDPEDRLGSTAEPVASRLGGWLGAGTGGGDLGSGLPLPGQAQVPGHRGPNRLRGGFFDDQGRLGNGSQAGSHRV